MLEPSSFAPARSRVNTQTQAHVHEFLLTGIIHVASQLSCLLEVVAPRHGFILSRRSVFACIASESRQKQRYFYNCSKLSLKGARRVIHVSLSAKITKFSLARPKNWRFLVWKMAAKESENTLCWTESKLDWKILKINITGQVFQVDHLNVFSWWDTDHISLDPDFNISGGGAKLTRDKHLMFN